MRHIMIEKPDHQSRAFPALPLAKAALLASESLTMTVRKSDNALTVEEIPKDFLKMACAAACSVTSASARRSVPAVQPLRLILGSIADDMRCTIG